MSSDKNPREFWVETGLTYVKGFNPFFMAYSEKGSGWSVHCREVLPSDSRKEAYIAMLEKKNAEMKYALEFASIKTDAIARTRIEEALENCVEIQEEFDKQCAQIRARFEEGGK